MSVKLAMEDVTRHVLTYMAHMNVPVIRGTFLHWITMTVLVNLILNLQTKFNSEAMANNFFIPLQTLMSVESAMEDVTRPALILMAHLNVHVMWGTHLQKIILTAMVSFIGLAKSTHIYGSIL